MINEMMVPDVGKLDQKDKNLLLEFFNEWECKEIKSIYDQYKYGDEFRDKLDAMFLKILNKWTTPKNKTPENFMQKMNNTLSRELDALKNMTKTGLKTNSSDFSDH